MRALISCAVALALTSSFAAAAVQAPSANVRTMAGILAKLNHFPSDAEKATLGGIVKNDAATAHEKTLAQALINTMHTANAADKPKLEAILKDPAAPQGVKALAGVLASVNHTPGAPEKAAMTQLSTAP
jgi:hypothetical protein